MIMHIVQAQQEQMEQDASPPVRHEVTIDDTHESFLCGDHESLLHGMARLGRRGIPVGCRGGGCGICKVEITEGVYEKRPMSCDHVTEDDEQNHRVLACRVYPRGEMKVRVLGKMKIAVARQGNKNSNTDGNSR